MYKRLAISGLALIRAFKSIEGHSGYTVSAGELDRFAGIVANATWAAIALPRLLSVPYCAGLSKKKARLPASLTRKVTMACALTMAYGGILAANGARAVFTRMLARTVLEGRT